PVLESVVARMAANHPGVVVRRGVKVAGVRTGRPALDGAPHITGITTADGEDLDADLVVDAMGRKSPGLDWLAGIDARPPHVESQDAGFAYYTRYFTGAARPARIGPALAEYGSFSLLTLDGDNNTWSVTVFGVSGDPVLKELRHPEVFSAVVGACPLAAHWLDGTPITDVLPMAGLLDRYRRFVVDGTPCVTGYAAVGDAWSCTNPSAGRGLSVGIVHAQALRDAVRAKLDDPVAFVHHYDETTQQRVAPFFFNQRDADRHRIATMTAVRNGTTPPVDPTPMTALTTTAMSDGEAFRGMLESILCLAFPQDVLARDGMADRLAAHATDPPLQLPGPDRAQLEQIAAGAKTA
ncbi:MAG: FAD-dependent oxidoreductase, partial [Frankiales bacterium]|nr:FAD-dependent oxidoreductase [Frankiales bacterium]